MSVSELARKPNPDIVELLTNALEDAKAGKVIGVVMLTNDAEGYRTWSSGHWKVADALYLFEVWKHEMLFGDKKR